MAIVPPAKPKATIVEHLNGTEVLIPAHRNWLTTVFLGTWLCGWAAGEIMAPTVFLSPTAHAGAKLFVVLWFVVWTLGGGLALYTFLWSLAGRERILLTPTTLGIKRELFGIGRLREYELTAVRDLRTAPRVNDPFAYRSRLQFWGIGGGIIAFDHGAATVRFGASIEEGEAKTIVERLRSRASLR